MEEEKRDIRSLTIAARKEIRRNVYALLEKGWNAAEIARTLQYAPSTVYRWRQIFQSEGKEGITEKTRGGSQSLKRFLTERQEKEIQKTLTDKTPDQLKLKFCLWNAKAVQQYIAQGYKIHLAGRTVRLYLQRWGFSPQRPIKKAWQQDTKEVEQWLKDEYPKIRNEARREKAEIYWCDETGVSNQEHYVRGYAPRGKTPELKISGTARHRVNMISAINNQGKLRFMIYRKSMDGHLFILFLKRLIKDAGRKIYVITDNLKTHHSTMVQEWLEKNKIAIRLYYLPRYSPELNPDEYLNNDLKRNLGMREPSMDEKHTENKIRSCMNKTQRNPGKVRRFFQHLKVRYAA